MAEDRVARLKAVRRRGGHSREWQRNTKARGGTPLSSLDSLSANDSGLFVTTRQFLDAVERANEHAAPSIPQICGLAWEHGIAPLYEAKMIHHFDHCWASYDPSGASAEADKTAPAFRILPRYWVDNRDVEARLADRGWTRGWLMGWRDICRSTDERTVIASAIPRAAVGDKFLLMFPDIAPRLAAALLSNLCSLVFDFVARQKVGGTSLKYFTMKQLTALPPAAYNSADLAGC